MFLKNSNGFQGVGDWVVVKSHRLTQQGVREHLEGAKRAVVCGGEAFCTDISLWLEEELLLSTESSIDIMASTTK